MGGDVLLSRFRSTIGADGLNVPVRDGKGWGPVAIVTVCFPPPYPGGLYVQRGGVERARCAKAQLERWKSSGH